LDNNLESDFFKSIPSIYNVNGNEINFSKRYSNQFTGTDLPAIVLTYLESGVVSHLYLNKLYNITNKTKDVIEFEEDKYEYNLSVESGFEIESITGIVNDYHTDITDDVYTFEGYNENKDAKIIFDSESDDIPDVGTEFVVDYKHKNIKAVLGGEFIDRIQFDIITTDYKDDETFINGLRLCKIVTRDLLRELEFNFKHPKIVVRDVSEARNLTEIEGQDYHYRYSFDVSIAYRTSYSKLFNSIEEVSYELQAQVV